MVVGSSLRGTCVTVFALRQKKGEHFERQILLVEKVEVLVCGYRE